MFYNFISYNCKFRKYLPQIEAFYYITNTDSIIKVKNMYNLEDCNIGRIILLV